MTTFLETVGSVALGALEFIGMITLVLAVTMIFLALIWFFPILTAYLIGVFLVYEMIPSKYKHRS